MEDIKLIKRLLIVISILLVSVLGMQIFQLAKDYIGIGAESEMQKIKPGIVPPELQPFADAKCGDGTCGEVEQKLGICPLDCEAAK